jgi:hypothetical protein
MEIIIQLTALVALLAGSALTLRYVVTTDLESMRPVIVHKRRARARPAHALKRAA